MWFLRYAYMWYTYTCVSAVFLCQAGSLSCCAGRLSLSSDHDLFRVLSCVLLCACVHRTLFFCCCFGVSEESRVSRNAASAPLSFCGTFASSGWAARTRTQTHACTGNWQPARCIGAPAAPSIHCSLRSCFGACVSRCVVDISHTHSHIHSFTALAFARRLPLEPTLPIPCCILLPEGHA